MSSSLSPSSPTRPIRSGEPTGPSPPQSPPSTSTAAARAGKRSQPLPSSLSPSQQQQKHQQQQQQQEQDQDHQRRLEEASIVCARGRQYWTRDNDAEKAVAEFERALRLLETLLGTYHSLTAKTYYWLGFIRKHSPNNYLEALQAFVQTARIRLVLLGPSHESTQESIAAIRWVLLNQQKRAATTGSTTTSATTTTKTPNSIGGSDSIKQYLSNLYESIRLETLGDARLRHREYSQAIDHYQRAMAVFHDPTHATIMGKRAFCCFKRNELDQAMYWYRQALLIFTTQTVHRDTHPDVPTTLERVQQVLQSYIAKANGDGQADGSPIYSAETIQSYCATILKSVQEQYKGQLALDQGKVTQARQHLEAAVQMESNLLGADHGIVKDTLQPLLDLTIRLSKDTQLEKTMADLQLQKMLLEQRLEAIQSVVDHSDGKGDNAREPVVDSPSAVGRSSARSSLTPSTDQINAKLQTIRVSLTAAHSDDVNILEERLKNVEQDLQYWKTKSEQAQKALVDLEAKLHEQEKTEEPVQAQTVAAASHFQEQENIIQRLQDQVSDRDRRLEELQALIQSQKQTLEDYQAKIHLHSQKVEAWQSKVESLEQETIALRVEASRPQSATLIQETKDLANELQQAKQATKDLESGLQLAEVGMASLKGKNELSQHKLEESLEKQQALSKELKESATTIQQLQDQIIKLEIAQSVLREKLSRQEGEEVPGDFFLETPAASPARSKAPSGASPSGVSVVSVVEDIDPRAIELKARRLESQLQELSATTDDGIVRHKLESQNERAVKTIKALSKELIGMEEKYRKLGAKHEKLRLLFVRLEAKNRTIKEHNVQIAMAARSQQQQQQQQSPTASPSSSSFKASQIPAPSNAGVTSITNTSATDTAMEEVCSSENINFVETPPPSEDLLKSVRLSTSSYQSTMADFIIRRPFLQDDELTDEERRYFWETPLCSSLDVYAHQAHVKDPASIELVALIGCDHSRLYLLGTRSGETKIAHRRTDGTWSDLGTLDSIERSDPLGWVSSFPLPSSSLAKGDTSGNAVYYSLDEIVEEAQIYRQHYCQAVAFNAASGGTGQSLETKLLLWLATLTKSSSLESAAYMYGSKSFEKQSGLLLLERPVIFLFLILTVMILLLAIMMVVSW